MPYQKAGLFVGALALIIVIVAVVALTLNDASERTPTETTYVLAGVADGTYDGELPPLDHEIVFSDAFPEDARAVVRGHVEDAVTQLSLHPEDGNAWMDLALQYHTANDYEAARSVWEFLIAAGPANVTALNNLGRLHHFDVPDFPKAEAYFKQSLEVNPDRVDSYLELFDLYRYSYKKDTSAAVNIMRDAIAQFPDDIGLQAALGSYYRDIGNTAAARREFEAALSRARAVNDMNLISNLNAELARLP